MRVSDPDGRITMIAKGIAGIGMEEDIERTVIKREPFHDNGKLRGFECKLIRPLRMRTDGFFVEAPELEDVAEAATDFLAKLPCGVAGRCAEVDVGVPRFDGGNGG